MARISSLSSLEVELTDIKLAQDSETRQISLSYALIINVTLKHVIPELRSSVNQSSLLTSYLTLIHLIGLAATNFAL